MKSILFAAMLALTFTQASAASFDCAKARSANEKANCSNAELGWLDEVKQAYKRKISQYHPGNVAALGRSLQWWKN